MFNKENKDRKGTEVVLANEFYAEIRERNKAKFIKVRSEQIRRENEKNGGVNLPEFLDAENDYNAFLNAGCFDQYGFLKPIEA